MLGSSTSPTEGPGWAEQPNKSQPRLMEQTPSTETVLQAGYSRAHPPASSARVPCQTQQACLLCPKVAKSGCLSHAC